MEKRTCMLLICVYASQDDDARTYRAVTLSQPRLHHLRHADAVLEHITIAVGEHYVVSTRSVTPLPFGTTIPSTPRSITPSPSRSRGYDVILQEHRDVAIEERCIAVARERRDLAVQRCHTVAQERCTVTTPELRVAAESQATVVALPLHRVLGLRAAVLQVLCRRPALP
jgi:hypothetical protein